MDLRSLQCSIEDFNAALSYHSSFWWRWGMTYSPIWFLIPWCAVAAIAHSISGLVLLFASLLGGFVLFLILVQASRREEKDRVNTVKEKILNVIGNFHLENSKTLDVGLEWWEYVTYYDSRTGSKRIGSCGFDIVDLRAGTWKFPVHGQQLNAVNQPMQPMDHLNHQQSVSTSTFNIS